MSALTGCRFAPALLVLILLTSNPAAAKTCKDAVTAKATSRAEVSSKEDRARSAALAKWRTAARAANGWTYRFWSRAEDRSLTCKSTGKSATCTATARPCRLL
jgi:hypothetical protein